MVTEKTLQDKLYSCEWQDYVRLMNERDELFLQSDELAIVTDLDTICHFEEDSGKTVGVLYKSPYSILVVDCVRAPDGRLFCYERSVPASTGSAVVGVPIYEGKYVLLRQFRHSMRGYQYAFPRGYGEDGISAADNVKKEISEELGADVSEYRQIGNVISDSGRSGQLVSIFLCSITNPELKQGYEGIDKLVMLSPEQLEQWVADGRINDGYTLSAYAIINASQKI